MDSFDEPQSFPTERFTVLSDPIGNKLELLKFAKKKRNIYLILGRSRSLSASIFKGKNIPILKGCRNSRQPYV